MNEFDIKFEPVAEKHYPLLKRWLNAPHIREWWGEPETELGYIIDMVEGRDTTKPYIFHVNGEPTGYIQVWRIGPHQTEDVEQGQSLAHGACRRMRWASIFRLAKRTSFRRESARPCSRRFVDKLKAEGHTRDHH